MSRRKPSLQDRWLDARSDYSAAQQSRFRRTRTGIDWQGSGADYHVRTESSYWKMVETFRSMERDDVVLSAGVDRLVDNVIQGGFVLDPKTGSKRLDDALWSRWMAFAEDAERCDVAGELRWHDVECLAVRRTVIDGDMLVLATDDGPLQLFEGHRLRTPTGRQKAVENVFLGIERDDVGRKLAAWVTHNDVDPTRNLKLLRDFARLPFRRADGLRQAFQTMLPTRPGQARGFSLLTPVVDVAGMHDDVQFATLVKQQIASAWAIVREVAADATPGTGAALGSRSTETLADGSTRMFEGIGPGMDITLRPGEEAKCFSPNVPSSEFFQHATLLLTFLAINLKIPVSVLLLDPSNTNFSGWRGALDEARKGFSQLQRRLISTLHTPLYRLKVQQWLESDPELQRILAEERIAAPDALIDPFAHGWNPPRWRYIEPLKDATAELLRHANSLDAPRVIMSERGIEWETHCDETIADNVYAIRKAKEAAAAINKEFDDGNPCHWRELMPRGSADGIKLLVGGGEAAQQDVTKTPPQTNAA